MGKFCSYISVFNLQEVMIVVTIKFILLFTAKMISFNSDLNGE
jgi:hypothetical protein